MALDRTWYNSLVDDDGSNTVGSVWDKADVNQLMNATDAEIARVDAVRTPYTPGISNAESAGIVVPGTSAVNCSYSRVGHQIFLQIYAINMTNPAPSASIYIAVPPQYPQATFECSALMRIQRGATSDWGFVHVDIPGYLRVFPGTVATWPAGNVWILGQLFYYIA